MTLMEFFGCTFLAFGPSAAMFVFTIIKDPIRIIILIASAFFWLLSLLLSSLFWFIVYPLRDTLAFGLVFSVLFQELFRYFIYKLLKKAEAGLKKVTDYNAPITNSQHILAYVSGLGFGLMSGAFSLVNVLADALGPGTMGLQGGSYLFFITSASTTLCFILLHTFWGVIFFSALDHKNWKNLVYVVLSHLFVSCITLLNRHLLYTVTLIINYCVLVITAVITFYVAGGSFYTLKNAINCKQNILVVTE